MAQVPRWSAREVVAGTLAAVIALGAIALLVEFRGAIVSLFVAVLLSSALQPLVARVERRAGSRVRAAVVVHVAVVVLFISFAVLVLPVLVRQVASLWDSLPGLYASLRERMAGSDSAALQRAAAALPPALDLGGEGPSLDSVSLALAGLGRLGSAALTAAGIVVLSFSWTVEGERVVRSLLRLISVDRRAEAAELVRAATDKLAAFVRGQIFLCAAVGACAFVAYALIGVPHAAALGVVAGLFEAIPIIGPTLGAVPAALVAISVDPTMTLWVGLATVVIQLLENYLLVPRVMDRSVGVHPLVTILAITAFGALLGIIGALLAIPLAALAQVLIQRFVLGGVGAPSAPSGRDQISALRYEAQHLAHDIRQVIRHKEDHAGEGIDADEDELEAIVADLDRVLAHDEEAREEAS